MKKLFNILKGIITVILLVLLFVIILQKVSNNKITVFGYHIFTVASESMVPVYQVGDIIISKTINPSEINVGDDVTYLGEESNLKGLIITHRVIEKNEIDGKYYFITKGVANDTQDPKITESNILGKVVYKTVFLSFFGRLMKNIVFYYLSFMIIGVGAFYEFITIFIMKDDKNE